MSCRLMRTALRFFSACASSATKWLHCHLRGVTCGVFK